MPGQLLSRQLNRAGTLRCGPQAPAVSALGYLKSPALTVTR